MKRLALILLLAVAAAPLAHCAPDEVNDMFRAAQTANDQHDYDGAIQLYQKIATAHPERGQDAERGIAEALFRKAETAKNDKRFDDAIQLYQKIEAEHPSRSEDAHGGIADTLLREAQTAKDEKRYDDAIPIYQKVVTEDPRRAADAEGGIADAISRKAQMAMEAKQYDDAIHLYETILEGHPEWIDGWYSVQRGILDALVRKGDLADAAKAVHVCMDAAPNLDEFNGVVAYAANILSALDKNVDRANQLIAFEQSGPKAGAVNPMDAIGYPTAPDREAAFATMRQQAGDSAAASRVRAYTYLFTGMPKDAMEQFADEFRRSSTVQEMERAGQDLAIIGLRDVQGHGLGLDKAMQYIIYGSNGPDGKPGTADDLADPFAKWLPPAPAPDQGGLAGLSADDLTALRKVRDACLLYAPDPWIHGNLRLHSFLVLQRVNSALDNWGAPGQAEWYLQIAYGLDNSWDLLMSIVTSARGRALNFGGVYPVLAQIDARVAAKDLKPTNEIYKARAQFSEVCTNLGNARTSLPPMKPMDRPATF